MSNLEQDRQFQVDKLEPENPSNNTALVRYGDGSIGGAYDNSRVTPGIIGGSMFSPEALKILGEPVDPEAVQIRPDGIIFLPEMEYRNRLHRAFNPGGWGLKYIDHWNDDGNVYYKGQLYVNNTYIGESLGEAKYIESNKRMTLATSLEGAKSNCLMRCCKDLGIANELWLPRFIKQFKALYCVEVWVESDKGQKSKQWRKLSDEPINQWPYKEVGLAVKPASPVIDITARIMAIKFLILQNSPNAELVKVNNDFIEVKWNFIQDWADKNGIGAVLDAPAVDLDRIIKGLQLKANTQKVGT